MAEPRDEQIIAKVQETIASIVSDDGATYWTTFSAVVRARFAQQVNLDSLQAPLCILRRGELKHEPRTTRYGHTSHLTLFATPADRSHQLALAPQFQTGDVSDEQLQARMTNDIRRALDVAWPLWSLGVVSLEVSEVDTNTHEDGWAFAHLLIEIDYQERLA